MSDPFGEILAAMCAAALAVDGVGAALPTDGRDPEQMAAEATKRRATGAAVFCRVAGGDRVQDAPRGTDRTELALAFAAAVPSLAGRGACLAEAYALWYRLYQAVSGSRLSLDWLDRPLQYRDWALVYDSPQCAIVDLVTVTRFDLARWSDASESAP